MNILKYVVQSNLSVKDIASSIGLSEKTFLKRCISMEFTASEIYTLCDLLNIPNDKAPEVFF